MRFFLQSPYVFLQRKDKTTGLAYYEEWEEREAM
jgi:hypothetical protein